MADIYSSVTACIDVEDVECQVVIPTRGNEATLMKNNRSAPTCF